MPYARAVATAAMFLALAGGVWLLSGPAQAGAQGQSEQQLPPANTIEGALARSPNAAAREAAGAGPVGETEKRLAAIFKARGVQHFKPSMIRDVALAELETGTPAGVLASISEREFSHDTVKIAGSIPGTVSSRGYFTAFAFKPISWEYYKYELWGNEADAHDPFDYGDAAMMCGTILQHYREPGNNGTDRMQVDPLGSLRDYNANYAAGVLKDATDGKYASPLWEKLKSNLLEREASVPVPVAKKPSRKADEQLVLRRLRARILRFVLGFTGVTE